MKKFLVLLGILVLAQLAPAKSYGGTLSLRETLEKLPPLKQGVAYSIADSNINYLATIEFAKWKFLSFEGGYAGRAEETKDKIVGVVSTNLLSLKRFGFEFPLADLIDLNIGLWAGVGSINMQEIDRSEFDWGISATLLSVKF